jgi:hypothetical protein
MSFRSDSGGTTVIVLRDGQPVSVDQVGPVPGGEFGPPPQAPEQRNEQSGLWLALLGLSALAPITWAAMAWARRPGQAEIVGPDPNFVDGFVPRRDD